MGGWCLNLGMSKRLAWYRLIRSARGAAITCSCLPRTICWILRSWVASVSWTFWQRCIVIICVINILINMWIHTHTRIESHTHTHPCSELFYRIVRVECVLRAKNNSVELAGRRNRVGTEVHLLNWLVSRVPRRNPTRLELTLHFLVAIVQKFQIMQIATTAQREWETMACRFWTADCHINVNQTKGYIGSPFPHHTIGCVR